MQLRGTRLPYDFICMPFNCACIGNYNMGLIFMGMFISYYTLDSPRKESLTSQKTKARFTPWRMGRKWWPNLCFGFSFGPSYLTALLPPDGFCSRLCESAAVFHPVWQPRAETRSVWWAQRWASKLFASLSANFVAVLLFSLPACLISIFETSVYIIWQPADGSGCHCACFITRIGSACWC